MVANFELLKRTYPVSKFDRNCDGYKYILDNTSWLERRRWGIKKNDLQRIIKEDEKYIYLVAKEDGVFRTMCLCFSNYAFIREHIFGIEDD